MLNSNATLIKIKEITKNIKEFTISFDMEVPLFKAGQFCVFGVIEDGKLITRSYSIASSPDAKTRTFYIVLVEDGLLTPKLFNLKEGDKVFASPRGAGHMTYMDNLEDTQDIIFCATGTGVAPFKSMLSNYEDELKTKKITLLQGVRFAEELGYKKYFEELAKKYPNFKYYPCVSREEIEGTVHGRITSAFGKGMLDEQLKSNSLKIMMCGSNHMIEEVSAILKENNIDEKNIIKEGY